MSQAGILNVKGDGTSVVSTLTGNSGGPVPPTASNINVVGTGSITVVGTPGTSTLTTELTGLTNHDVLVGAGTATITSVSPSTAGFVLTSNGISADPSFQVNSAAGAILTVTGNSGGQESPSANNFNILGSGSITSVGSAATETIQLTGLTNHALQVGAGTTTLTQLATTATAGQVLQSAGASADPAYSTATYPSTTTINQLLYSSSANTITGLSTANNGVLITSTTGVPSVLPDGTTGQILTATTGSPPSWVSPATSGTVTSVSGTANQVSVATGTTTPVISLIGPYSPATYTAHGVLIGEGTSSIVGVGPTATAGQVLQSGGSSADPAFSTAAYSATTTINQVLYSSAANTVSGLSTANNGVLITSAGGVPSILADGTTGQILTATTGSPPSWASPATSGTVTSVSVASANGFAGTVANATTTPAITLSTSITGVLSGNGTAISGSAVTQHDVLVGGATNAITSVAPSGTSGVPLISQGSSSDPVFGTAVVAGGGTGNTTQPAYSLVCGGTTTTGAFQSVADVATGSVLISGGTGALPSYSAYPQISGLGIGASPGSTAGITFNGTNFINNYAIGTFTPTWYGSTTTGTTTYIAQVGSYTRIGNLVQCQFQVVGTAATGTGNITIGGLPFTINSSNVAPVGTILGVGGAALIWPTGTTMINLEGNTNTTTMIIFATGSAGNFGGFQIANTSFNYVGNIIYQI